MKNATRNYARRQRRNPVDSIDTLDMTAPSETQADPLAKLEFTELVAAIDVLPSTFKQVVLLCGVEGFQYEEAAEIMDVPIGTIRSRLSRARRILRRKLEGKTTSEPNPTPRRKHHEARKFRLFIDFKAGRTIQISSCHSALTALSREQAPANGVTLSMWAEQDNQGQMLTMDNNGNGRFSMVKTVSLDDLQDYIEGTSDRRRCRARRGLSA